MLGIGVVAMKKNFPIWLAIGLGVFVLYMVNKYKASSAGTDFANAMQPQRNTFGNDQFSFGAGGG